MPVTYGPAFPTELLREILSHLQYDHSKPMLYASSLVNSNMYRHDLSREVLFREVTATYRICSEETVSHLDCSLIASTFVSILDLAEGGATAPKFYDFLQRFPHLQPYVRVLKIKFLGGGRFISLHYHTFSLGPLLQLLRKLETLTFTKLERTGPDVYHQAQIHPRTMKNLLRAFLLLPHNLSHPDTRGFAIFPVALVLQCPAGLKRLSFTRLDEAMPSGVFYQRLQVKILDIRTCPPDPQTGIDVSTLRNLRILTQSEFPVTPASIKSIIGSCKDALESLEVSTEWFKRGSPSKL